MVLNIHQNTKLREIQKYFNRAFPFLKIEFFKFNEDEEKVYSKKSRVSDTAMPVCQLSNRIIGEHTILILGKQKVSTIEKLFESNWNLYVQVFRKSGKKWIRTITTDDWTLVKQNRIGRESTKVSEEIEVPDFDAYHEQN